MTESLNQKTIIITGAGGAIGSVIAQKFAEVGASLVLVSRNKQRLARLKSCLPSDAKCLLCPVAVDSYQSAKSVARQACSKFGRIDCLINTAGILGPAGEFHTNNLKAWEKVLRVNLLGTANMCHAVLPFMLKRKRGKIINFSGGGAVQPFPNFSAYATSKAAVVRFTENLAKEYQNYNIQINAVAPGMVNSKFLTDALRAGKEKAGEEYYQKVLEQKKSGGDSSALAAECVLFLCSPKVKLTGKLIAAKWDPWQEFHPLVVKRLNNTSEYTLRRIDNKYFKEIKK